MNSRKSILASVFISILFAGICITIPAHATPIFEYEIWMQAEASLDIGPIEVQGAIMNTGTVALDLTPQWSSLGGMPSAINTGGLEAVNQQLIGNVLNPSETFLFRWVSGTQEEDLSMYSGGLLSGSFGLIPLGSAWRWIAGGASELMVNSVWVNGPAEVSLPFNKTIINLDIAGQYIESTPLSNPVPEPSTMILLGTGLIGLVGWGRRKFRKN